MTLSPGSERRLSGVHPDLIRVVRRAASIAGSLLFTVTEGLRDAARQAMLVKAGKSQTMHSRHLTGHAVDLGVLTPEGEITWEWPKYQQLALVMDNAAKLEGVPVEWGGRWISLRDGPHWQLPWKEYPLPAPRPPDAQIIASAPGAAKPPQA